MENSDVHLARSIQSRMMLGPSHPDAEADHFGCSEQYQGNDKTMIPIHLHIDTSVSFTATLVVVLISIALGYLVLVPPNRLHANRNGVPIIESRFPGLGAIGFYANRYQ